MARNTTATDWTNADIKRLKEMYYKWVSLTKIAQVMHKSLGAIKWKVAQLIEEGVLHCRPSQPTPIEVNDDMAQEVAQLKAESKILNRKLKQYEKETEIQEKIIEVVTDSIIAMPKIEFKPYKFTKSTKPIVCTPVGLLSDLHIGEEVTLEDTRGLGIYNFDIMKKRMNAFTNKLIDILIFKSQGYVYPEMRIVMDGDIVSGIRHDELRETNELEIVEQLFEGAQVIASNILQFVPYFPKIKVDCIYGLKHSIFTLKYKFKKRYVNFDYIFYRILELLLRNNENIEFNIPKSFFDIIDIQGWKFLVYHGDDIKGWAGIPYYGMDRDIGKFRKLLQYGDEKFDYVLLAHFHTPTELGAETIVNGSMKGADEFALGAVRQMSKATQTLFAVHKQQGITFKYNIQLDHIR